MTDDKTATVLVYRDRLVPASEAHFLRRLYIGFERLQPVWIGCRRDAGLSALNAAPLILGRSGPRGGIERALFKQFGILPPTPDLPGLRPAVLHAHFGRGGALALPIARALRIPLVVTFHGGDATKEKNYRRGLVPTIFQRRLAALQREACLFICVSDFVREQLAARGFPPEKLHVLRYGIEGHGCDVLETPPAFAPYVLFAGRFVEKKGIAYLIEAMRRLADEDRDLRLVLVGDGPQGSALRRQAARLPNVEFRGWIANRELRGWMGAALAVCVPSVQAKNGDAEGLPNVVLEAMAAGTPVVGSHHAGIGEAIEHDRSGLLVPPGDPAAIAAALRRLLDEPGLRPRLGDTARAVASEQFDALTQSRRLEDLLLSVVGPVVGPVASLRD